MSNQNDNNLQGNGTGAREVRKNNPSKAIIILSIIIAAISVYMLIAIELPDKPLAGEGGAQENSAIGGDFVLTDHNGDKFSSDQLKGELSLVYFGFTYCPDICPSTLQKIAKVMDTLDKYQIKVTPVFVTVDPQRDKINILKEYLGHFNNKLIGLTGTPEEIQQAAAEFKVFYARSDAGEENDNNDYMVDHSSFIYLMDKNFKYKKHFSMGSSAEDIVEYIRLNK